MPNTSALYLIMVVVFAVDCFDGGQHSGEVTEGINCLATRLTDAKKSDFVMLDEVAFNFIVMKVHAALINVANLTTAFAVKVMMVLELGNFISGLTIG
jgi:hypothetical protein